MKYNLKDKIEITDEFLNVLIEKAWQEAETAQQQINNIDTSTKLGADVVKLLQNICTNYYVFIGSLEALAENKSTDEQLIPGEKIEAEVNNVFINQQDCKEEAVEADTFLNTAEVCEPFEYFVDFDEPIGERLTDTDLYG